ncbi:similar to An02g01410 [Aspergillus niger]|uniref:Similar to An02g01410 n=1 Tax=Aspergillus niger TaxID=5061 RepID=A0A117DVL8_ASPNG|nr:similar to An02g01410 [Aspergillus niger]
MSNQTKMHPPTASSLKAQKTKNTPNGSASSPHTTNARRQPLMDFSSLHPCSASIDDEDDEGEGSLQSSHAEVGSFSGVYADSHSHSHSHPLSSSSSASTPTQMQSYTRYQPSNNSHSNYTIPSGGESTPTSTTTAITTRLKSKSKSKAKSTTAHVHFLDQIDISDSTSAATNTNTNGSKSTEANGITAGDKTMPLGPRSRDLSLSESEISLLDIGPSLVYGDDGYIPLSGGGSYGRGYERGHGHGQGDGGGVSVVGRGAQGLQLE